jgi:hypothetical protein
MKKLFLLSILCVLFSTSFSQINGNYEILTKISITKNADAYDEDEGGERLPYYPYFGYRQVMFVTYPSGYIAIECLGQGFLWCFGSLKTLSVRGLATEIIETTCSSLIEDSERVSLGGEFRGSLSRKIVIEGTPFYFLFQINWDYNPDNPRNGQAEITIYKIENLGM